jgi:hypothetical protein
MLWPMEEGVELPLGKATLARLAEVIRRLPPGSLAPADVTVDELRLFGTWDLNAYYAPLDHVEREARAVLVATCPPMAQALAAHAAARDALQAGLPRREAWRRAATAAGPSGTFRTNLAHMLDGLGLAEALGVPTLRNLFGTASSRIHFTYCVRYPVIVNDRDYGGRRPQLLRYRPLARFVDEVLAPELASLPEAIVIPLGRVAAEAVASLIETGHVELERCLLGLPNPSGANGHREDDYERGRDELKLQLAAWFERNPAHSARTAEAG